MNMFIDTYILSRPFSYLDTSYLKESPSEPAQENR